MIGTRAGIGLRLVHDLVAKNGFEFRATIEPGAGSSFTIVIPHQ